MVAAGLEDYLIQCYRLTGEGAKDLKEGDEITVTGILKNYKGTVEFDKGSPSSKAGLRRTPDCVPLARRGVGIET